MRERLCSLIVVTIAAAFLGISTRSASADDVRAAAEAFARAQQLTLENKPGEAADYYELADELAPSPAALRNAARSRMAAGHIAMAATDAAELLRRYPDDAASRKIAEVILADVTPKLARIAVTCDGGCSVLLDGKATSRQQGERHNFFAKPGTHEVTAVFSGDRQVSDRATLEAGGHRAFELEAPPEVVAAAEVAGAPPTAPARRGGISRGYFIAGAVVTVALGAAATYEGLGTLDDRDHIRDLVAAGDTAGADAAYADAHDRQTLTNVLIGATAVAGVATITAAFFTRWSGDGERRAQVTFTPTVGGGALGYGGRF